jgi:spore coat polysaccharide biosynthesis protein SpsF
METNIVVIIQARTSSTRLPNKVLLPILGIPILIHQYNRVKRAKLQSNVVIATSTDVSDNAIFDLCIAQGIECYRGDMNNLLDRHYKAGLLYGADAIVKIPSDCPLISPKIIDKVIKTYIHNIDEVDYVSNLHPPSYPDGNDVEVLSMNALEKVWRAAIKDFELEHTTPYLWENPDKFNIMNVQWETGLNFSKSLRFTIDYQEDYLLIKEIYENLYPENPNFDLEEILLLIGKNPHLKEINSKYLGEYWVMKHLDELKTVTINY